MEDLLARYFSGEATEEEIKEVQDWRAAEEKNAKVFFDYKKVFLATTPKTIADQALLMDILEEQEDQMEIIPLWNQKLFRFAAAILLVLGAVFIVMQLSKPQQPAGEIVAEVTNYTLPDGSEVTLHKGASLSVGNFDQLREVTLSGKAFFEVVPDDQNPFKVYTDGVIVEVLGTSFVVNTEEAGNYAVLVESGKVLVAQNPETFGNKPLKIQLEAGQMGAVTIGEKGIKKKKISDKNYLAWKTKQLTFDRVELSNVSTTLEDVYNLQFTYENPSLKRCRLTATFSQKTADEVAEIIASTFNMAMTKSSDGFSFSGESCQ